MKETVRKPNHPWLVAVVIAIIGVTYFALLGTADYDDPGENLQYDITSYIEIDRIPTNYEELDSIDPKIDTPRALYVEGETLFVAGNGEVVEFDANDTEVRRFTIDGEAMCMTRNEDGEFFLVFRDHVKTYSAEGEMIARWDPYNERSHITSIDEYEGTVYLGDVGNRCVLQYDDQGNFETRIGEKNPDMDIPGIEVPSPYLDLAVNDEGHLWVVNPGELGLERYRKGGEIVTGWYKPSFELDGFSGCCNPTHIAFTPEGKLITAEKGLMRIKQFEVTAGMYEELVAGSALFPKEDGARDIAVDANGRILILDPRSDTVRVFVSKGDDHVRET